MGIVPNQDVMMKKILLVDDDPELRQLLATYLGRHGYDTLLLPDTRQLDAFLERYQPHLVVLDLMLPGEDGLAACRRLRGRGETLPIIMLTARGRPHRSRAAARRATAGGALCQRRHFPLRRLVLRPGNAPAFAGW